MKIRNRTLILEILIAVGAPILLFYKTIGLIFNEALNNDAMTHIIAVPFLIAYILYRKRKVLSTAISLERNGVRKYKFPLEEMVGILLCAISYALFWYGSYTFHALEIQALSIPIFVSGIILIMFNFTVLKHLWFPLFLLAFLIPLPIQFLSQAGSWLSVMSSRLSYNILMIFGIPVSLAFEYGSPIIYLQKSMGLIPFSIDLACSGLYSLIGFALFSVFISYISIGDLKNKTLILLLGFPLIYALNVVRISTIILVGHFIGTETAVSTIHLFGGWVLIFFGSLILLFISEKFLNVKIYYTPESTCDHHFSESSNYCLNCGEITSIPKYTSNNSDKLKYLLIVIITVSLLTIQVPVFSLIKSEAEVLITPSLGSQEEIQVFPEILGYNLEFVHRDRDFEELSGQDASVMYIYEPSETNSKNIWVGLEIGPTKGCLHPWELCLITWPQEQGWTMNVEQLDLRDITLIDNPPTSARYFAYEEKATGVIQVILYWYSRAFFEVDNTYEKKWVKISLIEIITEPDEIPSSEEEMLPVAQEIADFWLPKSSWSWFALSLGRNSQFLILVFGATLVTLIAYSAFLMREGKKWASNVFNNLRNLDDIKILEIIRDSEKKVVTESYIKKIFEESTNKKIDINDIEDRLSEAEKVGLVKQSILNIYDVPHLTWSINLSRTP